MNIIFMLKRTIAACKKQSVLALGHSVLSRQMSMSLKENLIVAVCQLNSTSDRQKNFEICEDLVNKAALQNVKMIFFPECFDHVGESKAQTMELAETLEGNLIQSYKKLAQDKSMWISLGGYHEKDLSKDDNRVYNSHIVINSDGEIKSVYRKVHLFDIDIPGGVRLKESDFSIPGNKLNPPVNTPVGQVGLGICYDVRFPEFSLALTKAGAEILTFPSAFTQMTGMAHWEPLMRCRAIESQCYVISAAQTGKHNTKRTSHGHAMIVDPWGCVVAHCSEGIGMAVAEIKLHHLRKIRSEMPVWNHRRSELYGSIQPPKICSSDAEVDYRFSNIPLKPQVVFYVTEYSIAFVNRKTVLPGHVLVCPRRCAKRLSDLSPAEVSDLFMCVQIVQKMIEQEYNAQSSTISIQDGPDAGQTIPHVHAHILPRKPGDFEKNDEIYEKLASHDKGNIQWRTEEDMTEEAERLRKYFEK